MFLSEYAEMLTKSTCCHVSTLCKDGTTFIGIFNGLSHWGRVEDGGGRLVENVSSTWNEDYSDYDHFTPQHFEAAGYDIID